MVDEVVNSELTKLTELENKITNIVSRLESMANVTVSFNNNTGVNDNIVNANESIIKSEERLKEVSIDTTNAIIENEQARKRAYSNGNPEKKIRPNITSDSIEGFVNNARQAGVSNAVIESVVNQLRSLNVEITKITTGFHISADGEQNFINKLQILAKDGVNTVSILGDLIENRINGGYKFICFYIFVRRS